MSVINDFIIGAKWILIIVAIIGGFIFLCGVLIVKANWPKIVVANWPKFWVLCGIIIASCGGILAGNAIYTFINFKEFVEASKEVVNTVKEVGETLATGEGAEPSES